MRSGGETLRANISETVLVLLINEQGLTSQSTQKYPASSDSARHLIGNKFSHEFQDLTETG